MKISCRMFARYAEVTGTEAVELELPEGASVADAIRLLRGSVPNGHLLPELPLVAVDLQQVGPTVVLSGGEELALLPPLAGG